MAPMFALYAPAVMLTVPAPEKVYCALLAPPPRLSVEPAFETMEDTALAPYAMAELMVAVLPAATVMAPLVVVVGMMASVLPVIW